MLIHGKLVALIKPFSIKSEANAGEIAVTLIKDSIKE